MPKEMSKPLKKLIPGDWIEFEYGLSDRRWLVLKNTGEVLYLHCPRHLVSSYYIFKYNSIPSNFIYLGHTTKRWWWKFIPWRDLITPYKHLSVV